MAHDEYQTLHIDGNTIAYLDSGSPGFPVVCIHGNSCSSKVFEKQFEALGEQYRLIALDLPGHGKSSNAQDPEKTYTLLNYAKILEAAAEQLNLRELAVIGFSMGGNIALQWSQMSKRIRQIIMISSAPMEHSERAIEAYPPYEGNYSAYPDILTKLQAREYIEACGFNENDHFMIEDAIRAEAKTRENMVAHVLSGEGFDETKVVSQLAIPLGIIVGENDPALSTQYLKTLSYAYLLGDQIFVLEEASHAALYHQSEAVNCCLKRMLQELDVQVKESQIKQFKDQRGVFARRDFKEGEIVLQWNLEKLNSKQYQSLPQYDRDNFCHQRNGIWYYYPIPERYVNRSANSNVRPDFKKLANVATRPISRGEEISIPMDCVEDY